MCCESTETFDLPREVIETLAHYRRLLDDRGWDWAGEGLDFFRAVRFAQLSGLPELVRHAARIGWAKAVVAVIGTEVPAGVVVIRIDKGGGLQVETGPARPVIAGAGVAVDVVIDSAADTDLRLTLGGREVHVAAHGASVETIDVGGGDPVFDVRLGSHVATVRGAVRAAKAAQLRLTSSRCVRWSVTDNTGGAWFPAGVLPKWDYHHRPFFHGHDLCLDVPAEPLRVVCTRGLEYKRAERLVSPAAGESVSIECDPVSPVRSGRRAVVWGRPSRPHELQR